MARYFVGTGFDKRWRPSWSVLMQAVDSTIGHSHNDERLDQPSLDQILSGLIDTPLDAGESGRRIENILPVLQI